MHRRINYLVLLGLNFLLGQSLFAGETLTAKSIHRSPVDVAIGRTRGYLLAANETSNSVSLLSTADHKVVDECQVGLHPACIEVSSDEAFAAVSCTYSGEVVKLRVLEDRLVEAGRVSVGFEPVGLTISADGLRLYVGRTANGTVVEVDFETMEILRSFDVGNWPRFLTLSKEGDRLAVGLSGDSRIAVIDVASGEKLHTQYMTGAINIGHLQTSRDGTHVYFPWMVYRDNPITPQFIRLGWVLASRIGRARFDRPAPREAISLDVPGKAVADPHGIVLSSDEHRMVVSASGTHELLVYRKPDLPFTGKGPGDLIDRRLLADHDLFYRIPVGGRPMGLAIAEDDKTVYVANYLNDSIQVINIESRQLVTEVKLGAAPADDSIRLGARLFYDGQKSLDQWYSCHSCHYNGGTSARTMDTWNDGTRLTNKTVLPLYNVGKTGPWTWHGWQGDLSDAMSKSFKVTMQGEGVSREEAQNVVAFLDSLKRPTNPFLEKGGGLSESARRGKTIFEGEVAGCSKCHTGPLFTDGEVHDVGTGEDEDAYDGFNTPSLIGLYSKVRFLHDGRAKSLKTVLTEDHAPQNVAGTRALTEDELSDLIDYLKSL